MEYNDMYDKSMKKIKRIGFILSTVIGALMAAFYVFSIVGLHSLVAYHLNALDAGYDWSPSVTREDMLNIARIYRVVSYVLVACALALKIAGFALFRIKKGDKYVAVTLIAVNSVGIIIKIISLIIAIPAAAYLNYTNATMQFKVIGNILFIAAQAGIIICTVFYLIKLRRVKKDLTEQSSSPV